MDTEEEEEGRGEESIWLVNFNAKADVSMYLWAQRAGNVSFYDHTREYLVFIVGGMWLTYAHVVVVVIVVVVGRILSFLQWCGFIMMNRQIFDFPKKYDLIYYRL